MVMDFLDPVFAPLTSKLLAEHGRRNRSATAPKRRCGHGAEAAGGHGGGHHGMFNIVFFISLAMVTLGIGFAWAVYQKRWISAEGMARRWPLLYRISFNKFYVDEIYHFFIVSLVLLWARLAMLFDLGVIDGIVNWWGRVAKGGGEAFSGLQSGNLRDYLLVMSMGVVAVLGVWLWL